MDFYEVPGKPVEGAAQLKQGDILSPVPFLAFSATQASVLLPGAKELETKDLTSVEDVGPDTKTLANIESSTGIVLSQSCDLTGERGRERPFLVARVAPWERMIKNFHLESLQKVVTHINRLRNPGRTPTLFYLPAYEGAGFSMPRSVAHLLEVECFPSMDLEPLAKRCLRLRLSEEALRAFQERLAYCFGRFGAPDHLYFNEEEWQYVRTEQARKKAAVP